LLLIPTKNTLIKLLNPNPELLLIEIEGKQCEVVSISPKEVECIIPPWNSSDEPNPVLRVFYDSEEVFSEQLAYDNEAYPVIQANPLEGSSGDSVRFYLGHYSDMDGERAYLNGAETSIYRSFFCARFMKATIGENVHDDSNIRIYSENLGISDMMWTTASYTLEGDEYFFRTTARITGISQHQGNALGGEEITITGKSFLSDPKLGVKGC